MIERRRASRSAAGKRPGHLWVRFALAGALLFGLASARAAPVQPRTILLSQTARGYSAEGRSQSPAVNGDGSVAAYSSNAIDLTSPRLRAWHSQMYARVVAQVTSDLVSRAPSGVPGNQPSQDTGFPGGISEDGRYVAFSSLATNLVPDDTNGVEDVFVYDRELDEMSLISRGVGAASNGASTFAKISGDGRYVVFQSNATNLVPEPGAAAADIYVFDRGEGVMQRVSISSGGTPGNGASITPNMSADGQVVAFASRATNLVAEPLTGTFPQLFVRDLLAGTTAIVSVSSSGVPGNAASFLPSLSADGSQVAFKSDAFNLVTGDTNGVTDVFVRDRTKGMTQRVSVDDFGNQADGESGGPGISGDGRFVAFPSVASNLIPDDGNNNGDVYVYDRFPPLREQGLIARVTVGMGGGPPDAGVSDFPVSVSGDGSWIGYSSASSNLVPNDTNNDFDAFMSCNPFREDNCETPPPTPTPTATPTPVPTYCVGDCDGTGSVSIGDLVRMVNIALGLQSICPQGSTGGCLNGDSSCDCEITVDEIIQGVQNALNGCMVFGDCPDHEEMCCG